MSHRRSSAAVAPSSSLLARRGTTASSLGLGLDLSGGASSGSPSSPTATLQSPPTQQRARAGSAVTVAAGNGEGEHMEPDELFRRMTVGEVKRVEGRLRSSAMSKQSELRTMVGERYRDLLSSSVALSTLFSSSSRLSAGLKDMKQISSSVGDVDAAAGTKGTSVQSDAGEDNIAQELSTLLPLASQTKLLLDAPETLWRFLESKQFLQAAWLFCLGRVVHQEVGENNEGNIQLPLLQRQWESLSQFRSQIVQRATMGLRELGASPSETSQTLISIILLDSIPLPSALALLLAQRTRLLRDAVANSCSRSQIEASTSKKLANGDAARSRTSSAAPTRRPSVQLDEGEVKRVLGEIVGVLGGTVGLAREVFGSPQRVSKLKGGKSLIVGMMEGIEKGEDGEPADQPQHASLSPHDVLGSLPPSTPTSKGDKTHQRRASRLASISAPFSLPPPSSPSANGSFPAPTAAPDLPEPPVISTPSLLLTLPSSPLLLRYLPPSVKSYTPFLSSSPLPPSTLASQLATWLTTNTSLLQTAVEDLSASLPSVRAVWEVRDAVGKVLQGVDGLEEGERSEMRSVLEAAWERRAKEIWEEKLVGMGKKLGEGVRERVEVIKGGGKESDGDIHPPNFLFSPSLPFPSSSSSIPPSSSLPTFRTALRRRVAVRTPLLDSVLRELEALSSQLQADVDVLRGAEGSEVEAKLLADYRPRAEKALEEMVTLLERELEVHTSEVDAAFGVNAELFIGRVAIHLLASKSFLSDVLGEDHELASLRTTLLAVHSRSLQPWRDQAVNQALSHLNQMFEIDPVVLETTLTYLWKPSSPDPSLLLPTIPSRPVLLALHSLASAVQTLGPPPSSDVSSHGRELYRAFMRRVVGLPGWEAREGKGAVQALWDLRFLEAVGGSVLFEEKEGDGDEEGGKEKWERLLKGVEKEALTSIPKPSRPQFTSSLTSTIHAELLRTQTILSPLLSPSTPATTATSPTSPKAHAALARRPSAFAHADLDARHLSLLRLGVPTVAGAGAEMQVSLAVVSPSQRFGMLSVGGGR